MSGQAPSLCVVRRIGELRARVDAWRSAGESVGLVPTMGALHAGHMALVERAMAENRRIVATLFVNPKQFGPNEDLGSYPRDEARDIAMLGAAGADLLFAPDASEVYPPGHATGVRVAGLGEVLEGAHRPGFFDGVATVVAKLLNQAGADRAYFGEKDFQQLQVIRRMARDLDIPTEIVGVATVRDGDGLALSSRNAYLTAGERAIAPHLFRTLTGVAERIRGGASVAEAEAWGRRQLIASGFAAVDYVAVRDAESLTEAPAPGRPLRVLGAATLGRARLIDNLAV